MTTAAQSRSDAGLATALRISVSRLARRLRVERIAQGSIHQALSDTQLAALAALTLEGNNSDLTASTAYITGNPEEPPANPGQFFAAVSMLLDEASTDDAQITGGGIGTLLVAALFMRVFPELRRLERLEG